MRTWRRAAELWCDPRRAGLLMWAYFLLTLAAGPGFYLRLGSGPQSWIIWQAIYAFLAWFVTRGGWRSRMLLIIVTGPGYLLVASAIAKHFVPLVFGALVMLGFQLARRDGGFHADDWRRLPSDLHPRSRIYRARHERNGNSGPGGRCGRWW